MDAPYQKPDARLAADLRVRQVVHVEAIGDTESDILHLVGPADPAKALKPSQEEK
jgi:hypothetical protein